MVTLMAVRCAHGVPAVPRECWEAGVVLAGPSAGSVCWHVGGPTGSYRDTLDPFVDVMALLPLRTCAQARAWGRPEGLGPWPPRTKGPWVFVEVGDPEDCRWNAGRGTRLRAGRARPAHGAHGRGAGRGRATRR